MDDYSLNHLNSPDRPSFKLAQELSLRPTDPALIARLRLITTPQGQAAIIRKADELAQDAQWELLDTRWQASEFSLGATPVFRNKKTGSLRVMVPSQAIPLLLYGPEGAKALERDKGLRSTIEKTVYSLGDPQNVALILATGGIAGASPTAGRIVGTMLGGAMLYQGAQKLGEEDYYGATVDLTAGALGVGYGYMGARRLYPAVKARLFHDPTVQFDPSLPASFGETDPYGNIKISPHGSDIDRAVARYHEDIHSLLSPKLLFLRDVRAGLMQAGYDRVELLRYLEEALAETNAQLRIRGWKGLPDGLRFPIKEGYVEATVVKKQAAIGIITVGGIVYYVYIRSSKSGK